MQKFKLHLRKLKNINVIFLFLSFLSIICCGCSCSCLKKKNTSGSGSKSSETDTTKVLNKKNNDGNLDKTDETLYEILKEKLNGDIACKAIYKKNDHEEIRIARLQRLMSVKDKDEKGDFFYSVKLIKNFQNIDKDFFSYNCEVYNDEYEKITQESYTLKMESEINYKDFFLEDTTAIKGSYIIVCFKKAFFEKNIKNLVAFWTFCRNLVAIDVSGIDTSNMVYMNNLFYKCGNLKIVKGLENWETQNFEDISCMFYGCFLLKDISPLKGWDIKNVLNMSKMFFLCKNLKNINLFLVKWLKELLIHMKCLLGVQWK